MPPSRQDFDEQGNVVAPDNDVDFYLKIRLKAIHLMKRILQAIMVATSLKTIVCMIFTEAGVNSSFSENHTFVSEFVNSWLFTRFRNETVIIEGNVKSKLGISSSSSLDAGFVNSLKPGQILDLLLPDSVLISVS